MYKSTSRGAQRHPEMVRKMSAEGHPDKRYIILVFFCTSRKNGGTQVRRRRMLLKSERETRSLFRIKGAKRFVQLYLKRADGTLDLVKEEGDASVRKEWETTFPKRTSGPEDW